jgi:broad specificity phosphatase PhoE
VSVDEKFAALTSSPTPALLDDAFKTILGRWARSEWTHDAVEHVEAFVARVRAGIDRVIRSAGPKARIAIATSAGPIGVAVGLTYGSDPERMVRTSVVIRNASITELKFRSRDFTWQPDQLTLFTFNSVTHLPADLRTDR